jgi:Bifunctional DNA primase/polymerase, N-terminal
MDNSTGRADSDTEDAALAGALFMVRLGARVLPVARRTKRALLKNWTRGASNYPDEVKAWAQHHPGCNWGMVCDSMAVLDVDRHPDGPDGHAVLAELEAEHGKLETWLVHTPQNGRHYYFTQPRDMVRNLKRDDVGIELRGSNGYILLAGSSTPHGAYRWDPELHPDNTRRTVLPAHVHAFVAGMPMKGTGRGHGAGHAATPSRENGQWPAALAQDRPGQTVRGRRGQRGPQ